MRISTVKGIGEMPIGTKLEGLRGKITKIFEQKAGNNEHGDWSMQTVGFEDSTGTIDLLLKDREPLHGSWKGKTVLIQAGEYKGKPSGIEIDEYKSKTRIKVTKSADILDGNETADTDPNQAQQRIQNPPQRQQPNYAEEERQEQQRTRPQQETQQQQRQATTQQQRPPQNTAPAEPQDYVKQTKIEVMRLAALYTVCHDAAVFQAASVHNRHGIAPHPASIGALATTLFIESNRKQIGAHLPATDLTKIPAPHFRMIDIVEAYEQHQRDADATPPPPNQPKNAGLADAPDERW